jgi:hypothetical protein
MYAPFQSNGMRQLKTSAGGSHFGAGVADNPEIFVLPILFIWNTSHSNTRA